MTFSVFSDRLYPVSERKIEMKNKKMIDRIDQHLGGLLTELNDEKKNKETFKCWNCDKEHPIEVKKDWGFNEVCPRCDLHLFDEAEKRDKRRDW